MIDQKFESADLEFKKFFTYFFDAGFAFFKV